MCMISSPYVKCLHDALKNQRLCLTRHFTGIWSYLLIGAHGYRRATSKHLRLPSRRLEVSAFILSGERNVLLEVE